MANFLQQPCDEGVIRSGTAAAPSPPISARWILAATILGSSMAFIDGTVVNVALPALQADLNATVVDVQWVVESYSLLLTAFLLLGGSLGDPLRSAPDFSFGHNALRSCICLLRFRVERRSINRRESIPGAGRRAVFFITFRSLCS
jgi:MFS family permease